MISSYSMWKHTLTLENIIDLFWVRFFFIFFFCGSRTLVFIRYWIVCCVIFQFYSFVQFLTYWKITQIFCESLVKWQLSMINHKSSNINFVPMIAPNLWKYWFENKLNSFQHEVNDSPYNHMLCLCQCHYHVDTHTKKIFFLWMKEENS